MIIGSVDKTGEIKKILKLYDIRIYGKINILQYPIFDSWKVKMATTPVNMRFVAAFSFVTICYIMMFCFYLFGILIIVRIEDFVINS